MKVNFKILALGLALFGLAGVAWAANSACNVDNCREQGGDRWSIGGALDVLTGGALSVESGGTFDVESGGTFDLAGTTVDATALELNRAADVSTRIVPVTAATLAVTEALHDGKIITLDRAGGIAVTMPEATGSGMVITFFVITKFTTDGTITLADVVNTALIGQASIVDSDTTDLIHMFTPGATEDLVTLDGTNTAGGLGCWIQYIDLATDVWSVQIVEGVGGTAPATPFTSTP